MLHLTKDPIKSEFQNYLILDFANESTATNKNILVLFLAFRVKRNSKNFHTQKSGAANLPSFPGLQGMEKREGPGTSWLC